VLLESNYEEKLLDEGPYPLKLKRRIAGPLGHLSNEQTAALLAEVARHGHPRVLLCHLSKLNNTPELAQRAARAACPALDVSVLEHGEAKIVDVVRTRHRAAKQLSLLF
jgi:phosphoribosyl 1,2-cyclic phosphodiesterase